MLKVNDKVKPQGMTRDGLTYGYVKAVAIEERGTWKGEQVCWVYWPQLKQTGRWLTNNLTKC